MFDKSMINKSIPIPIYYQLKNLILTQIRNGELRPGDMIPTELAFQNSLDLSRTTIRQALSELVMEGYLYRVKGKGTFVAKPKLVQDFMRKLEPFADQMKRINANAITNVLSCEAQKPSIIVQEALQLPVDENVIYLRRLRFANNIPIVLVDTYLPTDCSFLLNADLSNTSMYSLLARDAATKIVRVARRIEAVNAGQSSNTYLNIPIGMALLLTKTIGYNAAGRPIEYSVARYPGDRNEFVVELSVD